MKRLFLVLVLTQGYAFTVEQDKPETNQNDTYGHLWQALATGATSMFRQAFDNKNAAQVNNPAATSNTTSNNTLNLSEMAAALPQYYEKLKLLFGGKSNGIDSKTDSTVSASPAAEVSTLEALKLLFAAGAHDQKVNTSTKEA
jgi:hypothetical protein